jgi:phospholipid transport system transporter-binding protein
MEHLAGARVVDLGGVTEIHSALLAVMFAWMRDAQRHESRLAFAHVPAGLLTIARLYGVLDALPMESGPA